MMPTLAIPEAQILWCLLPHQQAACLFPMVLVTRIPSLFCHLLRKIMSIIVSATHLTQRHPVQPSRFKRAIQMRTDTADLRQQAAVVKTESHLRRRIQVTVDQTTVATVFLLRGYILHPKSQVNMDTGNHRTHRPQTTTSLAGTCMGGPQRRLSDLVLRHR